MGKRKSSEILHPSPKKEKRPTYEESSDSEVEEEEDDEVDHTGVEETKIEDSKELTFEPDEFRLLSDSFHEFVNQKQAQKTTIHNMEKLVFEWMNEKGEIVDTTTFLNDYRKYLQKSIRQRCFCLGESAAVINAFLSSEKSLSEFKSLPEKPPAKLQMYNRMKNIQMKGFSGAGMKKAYKAMADDPEGAREAEQMILEFTRQYAPQLQEFLDNHPNLTDEQKKVIANKVKLAKKKTEPSQKTPKTPKKSANKKTAENVETGFTLFCRTKAAKYRDLSDEAREKKLLKKYNKIPEEMRELFDSLAIERQQNFK